MSQTRDLRHPGRPVFAEELALWWQLLRVVQSAVRDVPELVCSLFLLWPLSQSMFLGIGNCERRLLKDPYPVFTRERAAIATELPDHAILLRVQLWLSLAVFEALDWDLGRKKKT